MIYDKLENLENYKAIAPGVWSKIIEFIRECGLAAPEPGRYEIDGDLAFASVQTYSPKIADPAKLEIHHNYADIQLLLAGEEVIYYAPVDGLESTMEYSAEKDCALFKMTSLESGTPLAMKTGNWALFLPGEGHLPCTGNPEDAVVKIVVKVSAKAFV